MEVRTYTNMWNEERKLYSIYDMTLPTPVSFKQIGLFAGTAIVWMPLMWLLHVPIATSWGAMLWFGPPIALAIFGNQKLFEGKSIVQYATSRISFIMQPKRILDGDSMSERVEQFEIDSGHKPQEPFKLNYTVWSRKKIERN